MKKNNPAKSKFSGGSRLNGAMFLLLALTGLIILAGCTHFKSVYSPVNYTLDDLSVDIWQARTEVINGYRGYAGKVMKVTPINGINWEDYSRSLYYEWDMEETGYQQITVQMSVLVEGPNTASSQISAYRPAQRTWASPSTIKWNGPANLGWTYQSEEVWAQFGGNAVEIPTGRWVDLTFTDTVDVTGKRFGQIYLDGHNNHQGLIDLTVYVRHFKVTMRSTTKFIALTFDDSPSDFTHYLIDKLYDHDIKATFFLMGMGIEARHPIQDRALTERDRERTTVDRQEVVKRIFEEGHSIGNLAYSLGSLTEDPLTEAEIRKELEDTQIAIQKAIYGEDEYLDYPMVSKYFRDPFDTGSNLANMLNSAASDMGLIIIGGIEKAVSSDDINWVVQQKLNDIEPWSISINKDPRSDPSVLRFLDILIPMLKAEGYVFVTLDEMIQRRRIPLTPGNVYTSLDPDIP